MALAKQEMDPAPEDSVRSVHLQVIWCQISGKNWAKKKNEKTPKWVQQRLSVIVSQLQLDNLVVQDVAWRPTVIELE